MEPATEMSRDEVLRGLRNNELTQRQIRDALANEVVTLEDYATLPEFEGERERDRATMQAVLSAGGFENLQDAAGKLYDADLATTLMKADSLAVPIQPMRRVSSELTLLAELEAGIGALASVSRASLQIQHGLLVEAEKQRQLNALTKMLIALTLVIAAGTAFLVFKAIHG